MRVSARRLAVDVHPIAEPDNYNDRGMRIGQLAGRLGINPKTIRYYESIGLLPAPQRRRSGYRVYGEDDAERLAFVRSAQRFGLQLDQIGEILAFRDRGERPCEYVVRAVREEVTDLDRRIRELRAARKELATLLAHAEAQDPGDVGRFCDLLEHREEPMKEARG